MDSSGRNNRSFARYILDFRKPIGLLLHRHHALHGLLGDPFADRDAL